MGNEQEQLAELRRLDIELKRTDLRFKRYWRWWSYSVIVAFLLTTSATCATGWRRAEAIDANTRALRDNTEAVQLLPIFLQDVE